MRYQDPNHFKSMCGYEINSIWYPRVTKIIEIKSKPGLESFFKEVGSYQDAEDIKNNSAKEGSLVHSIIGKLAVGEAVEVPDGIKAAVFAFQRFKEEKKIIFFPEFIERQIWSPRYRYAGTVDALALMGGKFGVLDIKTSTSFYPEYNLQTAAYVTALQEFATKKALALPRDITTRWILRVDQYRTCKECGSTLRNKGGREKVRNGRVNGAISCIESEHDWGEIKGEADLREFPYNLYQDTKAFVAAKILWEWDNWYWLKKIGYSQ